MGGLERGLIEVYTGEGKGKTTAAVGLAVRAVGAGFRVAFVQFVKGGDLSGELGQLERLGVTVIRPARASTGLLGAGITAEDRRAAADAWVWVLDALASTVYDVLVLDEINVAMGYGLVSENEVLDALDGREPWVEVVLTGRGAPPALIKRADLVTDMRVVKHPFDQGVPARLGIEY